MPILTDLDLKGCVAVIPTVSVANIPQLVTDLIIQNTNCTNSVSMFHEAFIPYVGPDPFNEDPDDICTALQAYYCEEKKLVIFQMRSPLVGAVKISNFVKALCSMLKLWETEKVIVLSSMYLHARFDDEIRDETEFWDFRYVASPEFSKKYHTSIKNLGCSPLLQGSRAALCNDSENFGLKNVWPGAGFARHLHKECITLGLPCIVILKFASDGYNIPDAERYLHFLNKRLQFITLGEKLKYPISWKVLKETNPPAELFA